MPAVARLHANMQASVWLGKAAPAAQQLQRRHVTLRNAGGLALNPAHALELRLACSVPQVRCCRKHRVGLTWAPAAPASVTAAKRSSRRRRKGQAAASARSSPSPTPAPRPSVSAARKRLLRNTRVSTPPSKPQPACAPAPPGGAPCMVRRWLPRGTCAGMARRSPARLAAAVRQQHWKEQLLVRGWDLP